MNPFEILTLHILPICISIDVYQMCIMVSMNKRKRFFIVHEELNALSWVCSVIYQITCYCKQIKVLLLIKDCLQCLYITMNIGNQKDSHMASNTLNYIKRLIYFNRRSRPK